MTVERDCRPARLSRRDLLGLLGVGAGLGLLKTYGGDAIAADKLSFPKGAIIRTLLEDLKPEALANGAVLFHEHLSNRWPLDATNSFTDDVDLMIAETKQAGKDGVSCIVDAGHPDMGRKIEALQRIAKESGVHIVASGGFYMQRTYPPDLATKSADQIADDLVKDAREQRLGAYGEIGQQAGVMTDGEKKVFEAVGKAQAKNGLPILTHNAYMGTRPGAASVPKETALRQLDVLESGGAKAEHVAIGHVCCLDDPKAEIPIQLAKRGAFVGFDRVTIPLVPDAQKVTTIMAFVEAGYADHLLISSDFYSPTSLKKNGGGGIAQAVNVFRPMLVKAGMKEDMLHQIFVDNSRRFLAFVPKKA